MAGTAGAARLLERCKQGEAEAWRSFFGQHFSYVHRVARRLGTPEAELDDACQEVFLVVFRKLHTFESGRVTTWIYRIVANVVSDRHRKRRFRARLAGLVGTRQPPPAPPARAPDASVEQKEAERMVGEVLAAMKPKKREAFALYELEGLSGPEIAEQVGCTVETVWARLHHARKDFARIAKKKGFVGP